MYFCECIDKNMFSQKKIMFSKENDLTHSLNKISTTQKQQQYLSVPSFIRFLSKYYRVNILIKLRTQRMFSKKSFILIFNYLNSSAFG